MQWFRSLIICEWVYDINPTTLQSIQFVEVLNGFCWVVLHLLSHALPVGTACSSGGFRWLRIICKELAPKIQIIIRAFLSVPPRKLFTIPLVSDSLRSQLVGVTFWFEAILHRYSSSSLSIGVDSNEAGHKRWVSSIGAGTQVGTSGQCTYQASPSNN